MYIVLLILLIILNTVGSETIELYVWDQVRISESKNRFIHSFILLI
jgi:hypothetical protein